MKLDALQGQKVGLCVSGGLDSRTVARKLKDSGVDVMCFTADLAQPDEADIADVAVKMAPCGVDTVIVDLKAPMAEACFEMIKAQAATPRRVHRGNSFPRNGGGQRLGSSLPRRAAGCLGQLLHQFQHRTGG